MRIQLLSTLAIAALAAAGPAWPQEGEAAKPVVPEGGGAAGAQEAKTERQLGPMDMFISFSRMQLGGAGFERHEATASGRRMVWWQAGSGPTLVMVHGVADQAGTWFRVAPALAESHRVLLIDLPGHGESEPTDGSLPMTTVIEGFETWLMTHALGEDFATATLIGNSMGAWIALLAAERHPQRVSRVVMTNGGPLRANTGELDLLPADREQARRLMAALRDPSNPPTPDYMLDEIVRRTSFNEVKRMFQAEADLESYLRQDAQLAQVETPIEILWGESDLYLGKEYPERLRAALPRARLTLVERCGHLPQAECPERYLDLLKELLQMAPPVEGAAAK